MGNATKSKISQLEEILKQTKENLKHANELDLSYEHPKKSPGGKVQNNLITLFRRLKSKYVDIIAWGYRFPEEKVREIFNVMEDGKNLS